MSLIIGIDIGTTSVKISLFDVSKKEIIGSNKNNYVFNTNEKQKLDQNYSQQSVQTIIYYIQKTLSLFDLQKRNKIKLISICGQMHGCVLWNKRSFFDYNSKNKDFKVKDSVSDLYNWEDRRCTDKFIASLPKPDSYVDRISSGFGCATIFWLQRNSPDFVKGFNTSGTVMDLLVAILCNSETPQISTQNATSWGYFNPIAHSWNHKILESNGFPTHLLPQVVKPGSIAGKTKFNWLGIEENTPVIVASGDMQCAVYASITNAQNKAVLSIGTSMQLSFLMSKEFKPLKKIESKYKSIDYFPYFENSYLSVAASLNGGNVLSSFVKTIQNCIQTITEKSISKDIIWDKLIKQFDRSVLEKQNKIIVKTTMFGERHDPNLRASVLNISNTIELNEMFAAVCSGIIDNIFEMMSTEYLKSGGVQQLIGTGSALCRNPILKDALERKLNIPVIYMDGNDADVGSVWVAYDCYYKSSHK